MRLQSGCRATLLLLLLLSHAGLDHRVSADGVAQQAGVAAGAREGGREDVILEDWCGSSEPFKSTGDGGAERSCRPRQNATTILPEGFQGCAGQASKVLPCLSTGTGEGVCETARREYSECLASVGNRMIRYKHGYLVMSGSDLLLSAALELYGEWAERELDVARLFLGAKDVVVQVGATSGSVLFVPMSRTTGPAGMIVGIEPSVEAQVLASGNAIINTVFNVKVVHGEGAEHDDGESTLLKQISIDGLSIPRVRLVVTQSGSRTDSVLMGAQSTIVESKPVIRMNVRHDDAMLDALQSEAAVACGPGLQMVMSLGYLCWADAYPLFNPANHRGLRENYYGDAKAVMLLCTMPWNVPHGSPAKGMVDTMQPIKCAKSP